MNPIVIETERLLLKGISPQVVHDAFATKSEEAIRAFFGLDESGYSNLKEMHEKGMETFRISFFYFLLIEKETGLPIGDCGFHTWNARHRRAELYYFMKGEAHKRKGYMKEALPQVIRYGFEEMNLHRIAALVADWNTPSVKLLQGNGFIFEGRMREDYVVDGKSEDSDCYSLLSHEWQPESSGTKA